MREASKGCAKINLFFCACTAAQKQRPAQPNPEPIREIEMQAMQLGNKTEDAEMIRETETTAQQGHMTGVKSDLLSLGIEELACDLPQSEAEWEDIPVKELLDISVETEISDEP